MKRRIAAIFLCLNVLLSASAGASFSDVKETDWFHDAVEYVYQNGLMVGYGANNFAPFDTMNRAMAVQILYAREGSPAVASANPFTDVKSSDWYYNAVRWGNGRGLVVGYGDGRYGPTDSITLEQLALILWNHAGQPAGSGDLSGLGDLSGWAERALRWCNGEGIFDGIPLSSVKDQATRAQAAVMLTRYCGGGAEVSAAPVPAFGDGATKSNVLALLDYYDPDGAYILRESGSDYMVWFTPGAPLTRDIGTAVHEQAHVLSYMRAGWNSETYYTGDRQTITVTHTDVYNSTEMVPYIPASNRTFRFDTYVGSPTPNMGSAVSGVYGLFNEFTAYSWGMNNDVKLFDYYKDYAQSPEDWFEYAVNGGNDRLAYSEFRYYILTYMLYAKDNYPGVYAGILNNTNFLTAFQRVDARYVSNIQKFERSLLEIQQILNAQGHHVAIDDAWFRIDGRGVGIYGDDYKMLMEAMQEPRYQEMYKLLGG